MKDFSTSFFTQDFPFAGSHLVEASAGTGKTYNIANIFASQVMENPDWRISQILVVTFTEAATKELRERLRGLLAALQLELRSPGTGNAQAASLVARLKDDPSVRHRAAMAVDLALLEFDRAAISTIHGFCGRALKRYAFESGLAFDTEPPADVKSAQLAQAARDWWRSHVALRRDPALEPILSTPEAETEFTLDALLKTLEAIQGHPGIRQAPASPNPSVGEKLLSIAFGLLDKWNAERAKRKAPDFDDVLTGLRDALANDSRGPGLVAALREEYRAILVDEFQDTDPVQYEIFRRAFIDGNPDIPVFFVGDPKQAIYAFRGGDIHTYESAAKAVPGASHYDLAENRRSTPAIMAAVNDLFRDDPPEFMFGSGGIRYERDISAAGGKQDMAPLAPPFSEPDSAVQFVAVNGRGDEAIAACANEICALLEQAPELVERVRNENGEEVTRSRKLSAGDVAVLVRGGIDQKGPKLVNLLAQHGVRAIVLDKARSVFKEAEKDAFRSLLSAIAAPSRAEVVRAALLTPFFGLQPADVIGLARADDADPSKQMTDYLQLFRELADAVRERGFLAAFDILSERTGFQARVAASGPRGERALTNILHFAELVHADTGGTGCNPSALLDWFVHKADDEAGEDSILRLESDGGAVRILTIHGSKGLEFPVVFVLGVESVFKGENKVLVYHGTGGELLAAPATNATALTTATKEDVDEGMRLLYVALTRAAWRCVVLYAAKEQPPPQFAALLNRAMSLFDGKVQCRDMPVGPSPDWEAQSAAAPAMMDEHDLPEVPKLPHDRGYGSYSMLSPKSHSSHHGLDAMDVVHDHDNGTELHDPTRIAPVLNTEPSKHPIFGFPGGEDIGNCWHAIFEEADFQADDSALRPLVQKKLLAAGMLRGPAKEQAQRIDAVLGMVRRTLDLQITWPDGSAFRLRDIPAEDRLTEWQFDFSTRDARETTASLRHVLENHWGAEPENSDHKVFLAKLEKWNKLIPKGYLTGFLDLVLRRKGRYYIVDWKSNSLMGIEAAFSHVGLRDEMASHFYFLQYVIYASALHRHLRDSLPGYRWEEHFGGICYIFLRGVAIGREAVWPDRPSEKLLDEFGAALGLPSQGDCQ